MKTVCLFFVKAAISAAFLYYATRNINLSSLANDIRAVNPTWLTLGLAQLVLIPVWGGARWRIVLRALGSPIRLPQSIRYFWIGMMCSQVLPSTSGGDAIRIVMAWRTGIPFARSAHSVILERLAMVFALVCVVALFQATGIEKITPPGAAWFGPAFLCSCIAGLGVLTLGTEVLSKLPRWRILMAVAALTTDARKAFLSSSGIRLAGLSLVTHLNLALACLWLGNAIGIHLRLLDYVFYISLITLITSLPLSIGGWGVREGAVVALFGSSGVPPHNALAFSVIYGLSVAAISILALPFLSFKKARQIIREHPIENSHLDHRKINTLSTPST